VLKTYRRSAQVWWFEDNCIEGQAHVTIGNQVYFRVTAQVLFRI
jgi:hypothetical protein